MKNSLVITKGKASSSLIMKNTYYDTLSLIEWDWLVSVHDFYTGNTGPHGKYETCDCSFSNSLKEKIMGENELPQERIEDADEYKKFFNDEITIVSALTDEQILERIHSLETVIRQARTRSQAANFTLNEKKKKMTREQRLSLEAKDREYKVKPVIEETKEKKAPQTKDQKMVAEVMKLLKLSEEDAVKWIKENY